MPSQFARETAEKLVRELRESDQAPKADLLADFLDRELEQVRADFQNLVDCCPCQNGCKPGDMSCATQRATQTLRRLEKE
jgi:hypothetical protein